MKNKKGGQLEIKENVKLEVHDAKTGKLLRTVKAHNIVTNAGLNLVRNLVSNSDREPTHVAVGTSATTPAATDTTLGTEVFRDFITRRVTTTDYKLKVQLYIDENSANGNTLVEAGIFNRSSAGTMLSHVTYSGITKTIAVTVTLTWEFTFSRV